MPRLRTLLAATAVAAVSATLASVPSSSQAASPLTNFALGASAFGTRVTGGQVPANSIDTGASSLGCTRKANATGSNSTAGVKIPGFGSIGATTTKEWTTRANGVVSSYAQQKIASISIAQSSLGSLSIEGLTSTSRAYHDSKGFHATSTNSVATIAATVLGQKFPVANLPSPGRSITIPGLATISVGKPNLQVAAHRGHVDSNSISIKVIPTGTTVQVGHTGATVEDGAAIGVWGGWSDAVDASALGGVVTLGKNPLTNSLCRGTKGVERDKHIAGLPLGSALGGIASISGLSSGEKTNQTTAVANGYTFGQVANVNLGNGQIKITGLRAQANVTWKKGKWAAQTSSAGTTAASVVVAGRSIPLSQLSSALNRVNIPGLAGIKTNVVTRRDSRTIEVVALQLTLLNATTQTKSVVNIGHAKLAFMSRR